MTVVIKGKAVGQKRIIKMNFMTRLHITYVIINAPSSARFKLWVFTKISLIYIFPSLAILSHVDKTKSANILRQSIRFFPWLPKNIISYLIIHFCLKKRILHFNIRKWIKNSKCFFKSSRNGEARKTDVILYEVAAKICQFDVTFVPILCGASVHAMPSSQIQCTFIKKLLKVTKHIL